MRALAPTLCLTIAVSIAASTAATAQQPTVAEKRQSGWEIVGLPALNFDADEGFGYGALVEMYDYGAGARPYRLTIQPTLFRTTKGRRDITLFVDAPSLLPGGWRGSMYFGREQQLATPYYGIGNTTPYDEALESAGNPYYYRFGRTRLRASADFQHAIGKRHQRVLLGFGVSSAKIDATPFDSGTTLLANENPSWSQPHRDNYVRVGLVYDSRDREIAPTRGVWSEALLQHTSTALGATSNYTRVTATTRGYLPIGARLVLAQRVVLQDVTGEAPFDELSTLQTSFKQQDGLGGANTIRGLPKDRFVGNAMMLSNTELRWHAADFRMIGKRSSLVLSTFLDAGRVWAADASLGTMLRDLHAGYGAGARVGLGESFVVAVDVGHSKEAMAPIYIGLGYLF